MKQYSYTGDVKNLKTLGYKFDKLFGRNHKAYSKNNITMFVVSKMALEIDMVKRELRGNYIEFVLKNKDKPKEFWVRDEDLTINPARPVRFKDAPVWFLTGHGNVMGSEDFYDKQFELTSKKHEAITQRRNEDITQEAFEKRMEELRKDEFYWDPVMFSLKNVNDIIELDNLHPLEAREATETRAV